MKKINWKIKKNKQLIEVFLSLKNKNKAKYFLCDLMTKKEIKEFSNRLEVAYMLILTKNTQYCAIIKKTRLNSIITRVSKWLRASLQGYYIILKRVHHHNPTKLGEGLSLYS